MAPETVTCHLDGKITEAVGGLSCGFRQQGGRYIDLENVP